jgi:hypothetical protein
MVELFALNAVMSECQSNDPAATTACGWVSTISVEVESRIGMSVVTLEQLPIAAKSEPPSEGVDVPKKSGSPDDDIPSPILPPDVCTSRMLLAVVVAFTSNTVAPVGVLTRKVLVGLFVPTMWSVEDGWAVFTPRLPDELYSVDVPFNPPVTLAQKGK